MKTVSGRSIKTVYRISFLLRCQHNFRSLAFSFATTIMNSSTGWRRNTQNLMFKITKVKLSGKKNGKLNGQNKLKGMLEITDGGFKFHLKGRPPVFWPFIFIAEYGFDDSTFFFRIDQSSPHIYDGVLKFKTNEAKIIYDHIQDKQQVINAANVVGNNSSEQPTTSMDNKNHSEHPTTNMEK